MSDVEKITFANHYRRRDHETASAWERRAVQSARAAAKQRRVKSWLHFATYASFMMFGASVSMCAMFAAIGDVGNLATTVSLSTAALIAGMMLAEKIER